MKTYLLLTLITAGFLMSSQADIPAPRATLITVTNLTAFPKYKFSYRPEDAKTAKPIFDGQVFSVSTNAELLIQSGNDPAQAWNRIKYEWKGARIAIKVESVKQDGKTIKVTYKTTDGHAPGTKSAATGWQSLPLFALAGVGVCGLVLLARRRKV